MNSITVLCIGKLKEAYWRDAIAEYAKRLSTSCRLEIEELNEEKLPDRPTEGQIQAVLEAEADRLLPRMEGKKCYVLCVEGKQCTSEKLSEKIGRDLDAGKKLCFVIGSSHGLSPRVKEKAEERLSFSELTFPHQLFRVMLLEQLYRSFTILQGKTYHK